MNNQIDPTSGLAINCRNCDHCSISCHGAYFDKCLKAGGSYCGLIHKYPEIYRNICINYSSWTPRKKTIMELLGDKIRKLLS
jgi:hypothetical protein